MPVKRELSPTPSDRSASPSPKKPKASLGRSQTPKSPAKSQGTTASAMGARGDKKTGPWSRDELRLLYEVMCPKRIGVKWDEVASDIPGRDAKSCQNKWHRIQGKILQAIEGMGGE